MIFLLLLPLFAQAHAKHAASPAAQNTLFAKCDDSEKSKRILSLVYFSEDQKWQTYVEVDVRGCLYTTRLWAVNANEHKLLYFMPPQRDATANGMEILGWGKNSKMVLVRTEEWQMGSDAADTQGVVAIDVGTGMVYAPNLGRMLDQRKDKKCMFRVTDAGFRAGANVDLLIRAQFSTFVDPGDTEQDVPSTKRCEKTEETWSFDFATGEVKQVPNAEPLLLYRKASSEGYDH